MVAFQRNFLYDRIIDESQAHVVYPGLDMGGDRSGSSGGAGKRGREGGEERGNKMLLSIVEAPGVLEGK